MSNREKIYAAILWAGIFQTVPFRWNHACQRPKAGGWKFIMKSQMCLRSRCVGSWVWNYRTAACTWIKFLIHYQVFGVQLKVVEHIQNDSPKRPAVTLTWKVLNPQGTLKVNYCQQMFIEYNKSGWQDTGPHFEIIIYKLSRPNSSSLIFHVMWR